MQAVRAILTDLIKEVGAASIDQLIYAWVLALLSKPLGIIGSGKIERVKGVLGALITHYFWLIEQLLIHKGNGLV